MIGQPNVGGDESFTFNGLVAVMEASIPSWHHYFPKVHALSRVVCTMPDLLKAKLCPFILIYFLPCVLASPAAANGMIFGIGEEPPPPPPGYFGHSLSSEICRGLKNVIRCTHARTK